MEVARMRLSHLHQMNANKMAKTVLKVRKIRGSTEVSEDF